MSPQPRLAVMRRLADYLQEIDDSNMQALIAELVEIKVQNKDRQNRPVKQYREKVDAYARLIEEAEQ